MTSSQSQKSLFQRFPTESLSVRSGQKSRKPPWREDQALPQWISVLQHKSQWNWWQKQQKSPYSQTGGWPTNLKNMLIKLDHFAQSLGCKFLTYLKFHHPDLDIAWYCYIQPEDSGRHLDDPFLLRLALFEIENMSWHDRNGRFQKKRSG